MTDNHKLTQAELVAEARQRFGDNPLDWAFRCPTCSDVATGNDFSKALAEHPRTHRDGSPVGASDILGQECIGRTLGALEGEGSRGKASRGCDWSAFGLFRGPWEIVMPDGRSAYGFALADAPGGEGQC
jgi:hypothetical protein